MFFDDTFERDKDKKQQQEQIHTIDLSHVDIVPFGEASAAVDTRSIALSHSHEIHTPTPNQPHINELMQGDDLELVPLHDEDEKLPQPRLGERKIPAPRTEPLPREFGKRIDLVQKRADEDLIMKHDYVPFRGRRKN